MTDYSVKEASVMALNAARGAYLSYGLAQEVAYATQWMLCRCLPAISMICSLLEMNANTVPKKLAPTDPHRRWQAEPGYLLCPIISGAFLTDTARLPCMNALHGIGPIAYPGLLLPFVYTQSRLRQCTLSIQWAEFQAICDGDRFIVLSGADQIDTPSVAHVSIDRSSIELIETQTLASRVDLSSNLVTRLKGFSSSLLVPESEESRRLGAG